MLWSLSKVLIFFAIVAALAFGAVQLMALSGAMTIQFAGSEVVLGPLHVVIGLLVLVAVLWVMLKLLSLLGAVLRFIGGDNTALFRNSERNRMRRGVDALSEGLVALATGDSVQAMAKAKKASKLLDKPEVTNLVMAQAAEQNGDKQMAADTYKKLLESDKTRFVGVQGLLKQKLAEGETQTALKLAEKAIEIQPTHADTQSTLLKLQTGEEDWSGARKTLSTQFKQDIIPRDLHRRRDGVMALSEARAEREAGRLEAAHELAIEANRLSPDFVPAAVLAARGYVEQGKPKYAERVLKAAWGNHPHPDLASAFDAVVPEETSADRLKRFETLVKSNAKHPESRLTMAELHIAGEDYAAARVDMGDLADTNPTMRSLTVLAAIERGEAAPDHVVRELLTKALVAQRDPEWICDSCGEVHKAWEPVCFNCEAFDTVSWKAPATSTPAAATAILPMIAAGDVDVAEVISVIDPVDVTVIEDQTETANEKPI